MAKTLQNILCKSVEVYGSIRLLTKPRKTCSEWLGQSMVQNDERLKTGLPFDILNILD